jgi:hypothetical protein
MKMELLVAAASRPGLRALGSLCHRRGHRLGPHMAVGAVASEAADPQSVTAMLQDHSGGITIREQQ